MSKKVDYCCTVSGSFCCDRHQGLHREVEYMLVCARKGHKECFNSLYIASHNLICCTIAARYHPDNEKNLLSFYDVWFGLILAYDIVFRDFSRYEDISRSPLTDYTISANVIVVLEKMGYKNARTLYWTSNAEKLAEVEKAVYGDKARTGKQIRDGNYYIQEYLDRAVMKSSKE